jgi:hypothetical protein
VSPFAFQRFWEEANKMDFDAIIGDFKHDNHFFMIGKNTHLLESVEHKKHVHTCILLNMPAIV